MSIPCRSCRESHKKCDGKRPCGRCSNAKRVCEEPISRRRGRPRATKDEELDDLELQARHLQDPRLLASHQLLLSNDELLFSNPELCAAAFGIALTADFFMAQVGAFPPHYSLEQHMRLCLVRHVSPSLLNLLSFCPASQWDIPFEQDGHCIRSAVRDSVTTPVPGWSIRRWTHRRVLRVSARDRWSVMVTGSLLPSLRVAFVVMSERQPLPPLSDEEYARVMLKMQHEAEQYHEMQQRGQVEIKREKDGEDGTHDNSPVEHHQNHHDDQLELPFQWFDTDFVVDSLETDFMDVL